MQKDALLKKALKTTAKKSLSYFLWNPRFVLLLTTQFND